MRILLIEPSTYNANAQVRPAGSSGPSRPELTKDKVYRDTLQSSPTISLTLPYLAALIPADIDVTIAYDVCQEIEKEYDLKSFDLVGLTCTGGPTGQLPRALEWASILESMSIPSVVGGPATIYDEHRLVPILAQSFDAVVVGDAEPLMPNLLRDVRQNSLKNIYEYDGFLQLQEIPVPRFDLVNFDLFSPPHVFPAMTARGCPRKCTFCSEVLYSPWRYRPVDEVINELRAYQSRFGANKVVFRDDDFLVHPKRSRELLTKMLPLGLEWTCQTDLHLAQHLDIAQLAIDAGLRAICFGLESVRAESRKDIGKNFFTLDGASELLLMLNEQGIETQINIIFGLDYDTLDVFDETVDFLLDHKISTFYGNILSPEPGTALYKKLQEEGRLLHEVENRRLEIEDAAYVNYVPKNLSAEQLIHGAQYARKRFHKERSPDQPFWLGSEKTEY